MGAAPRFLSMLATLLLVLDLFVGTASGSEDLQVTDQPARKFADEAQTRGDRRKEAQMRALQSVAPVEYGWTRTDFSLFSKQLQVPQVVAYTSGTYGRSRRIQGLPRGR